MQLGLELSAQTVYHWSETVEPTRHVGQKNLPAEPCLASLTHQRVRSRKMVVVLSHDARGRRFYLRD